MVQLTTSENDEDVVERMVPFFEKAAEFGSDIVVFPEYVLGYRIPFEHPRVGAFRELARKHGIHAISGLVESHGTRWATTALLVGREGDVLGRYLKTHPASGDPPYFWPPISESPSVAEARGNLGGQFRVFSLDFASIGILQCYDGFFPEAWGCTSYLGAEVIFWINGREGRLESHYCMTAAECYGTIVAANITNGFNTGFAGPGPGCIAAEGKPEDGKLFPATSEPGDQAIHAELDLAELRRRRKHLRQMHQRRPDLYGLLTQDVRIWQDYPDVPWIHPEAEHLVNRSQL
jgi:predicted amidohydrolase